MSKQFHLAKSVFSILVLVANQTTDCLTAVVPSCGYRDGRLGEWRLPDKLFIQCHKPFSVHFHQHVFCQSLNLDGGKYHPLPLNNSKKLILCPFNSCMKENIIGCGMRIHPLKLCQTIGQIFLFILFFFIPSLLRIYVNV